jgi:ABC-type transport system substrate-binding protein
MNLTQPPFDDIHVRKAMNWVMDKHALVQAWGGPTIGKVAHHIVPDTLFDNQLAEYDPYATPGDAGDLAKAKEALKGSRYGTGMCTATACKNIYLLADARVVDTKMLPVIESAAKEIGITFVVHTIKARTRRCRHPRGTSRSVSARDGARTSPARSRSSRRSSTAARSSRTATRTTRSSGSRRRSA